MRLQGAMLFVKDLSRMAAFYGDVLGLKAIADTRLDNWVEFEVGNTRFSLHAIPSSALVDYAPSASPPTPREANPIRLDFEVADVESERARLEALGVPVLVRPWGACDIVDPEGNVLGLRANGAV
jgi:catechol 2,3-dioxygenase-like lactoylglutathione lyase family enzyme